MSDLHLEDNEAYIEGRSAQKAKELLEKAESAGIDSNQIKTTSFGYIVPKELAEGEDRVLTAEKIEEEDRKVAEGEPREDAVESTATEEGSPSSEPTPDTAPLAGSGDESSGEDAVEAPPAAVGDAVPGESPAQEEAGEYDPSQHSVDEVQDYLASADDAERDRVLAAERDGKARKTILGEAK
jgi:hypothetical protein